MVNKNLGTIVAGLTALTMGYSARAEPTAVEYIEMPVMEITVEKKPVIEVRRRSPSVQYFNFAEELFKATPVEYFEMAPMYFTPLRKDNVM